MSTKLTDEPVGVAYEEINDGSTCSAFIDEEDQFCERGAAYRVTLSNGATYDYCEDCAEISHL